MSSLLHLLGHGTGCRWTAHLAGTMKVRTYFSIYIIHQSALFAASKKHHNSTAKVKYLQQQQRQDNFYCTTVTTTTPLPHHYHTTTPTIRTERRCLPLRLTPSTRWKLHSEPDTCLMSQLLQALSSRRQATQTLIHQIPKSRAILTSKSPEPTGALSTS